MAETVKLGPTFGDEVIRKGLGGLPFSWTADGQFAGRDSLNEEQNRKLDEVVAAHNPEKQVLRERIISDRQFFQQLAIMGVITPAEALAAVRTGELPHMFVALLQGMDEQHRWAAEMLLSGATQFDRGHPFVAQFSGALGWSDDQIDDAWRHAAAL